MFYRLILILTILILTNTNRLIQLYISTKRNDFVFKPKKRKLKELIAVKLALTYQLTIYQY